MSPVRQLHSRVVFGRRVRVLAGFLAAELPQDGRVLDVGCGDGSIAAAVMAQRPDVEVTGIDVHVRPSTKVPVAAFDGTTIPFGDRSFDAVTFVDVLHHTADPTVLLREAARVAGDAVVVKDHLADQFLARPTLRLMDWVGNTRLGVALPYNYWSTKRWQAAFREVGLSVAAETTQLGLYPLPASWLFDRRLHVVWRLDPGRAGTAGNE